MEREDREIYCLFGTMLALMVGFVFLFGYQAKMYDKNLLRSKQYLARQ